MQVGILQSAVLNPNLFFTFLQGITKEFKTSFLKELTNAEELILIAESIEELEKKFQAGNKSLNQRGLKSVWQRSKFSIKQRNRIY